MQKCLQHMQKHLCHGHTQSAANTAQSQGCTHSRQQLAASRAARAAHKSRHCNMEQISSPACVAEEAPALNFTPHTVMRYQQTH
jgi:hypothetical protein